VRISVFKTPTNNGGRFFSLRKPENQKRKRNIYGVESNLQIDGFKNVPKERNIGSLG